MANDTAQTALPSADPVADAAAAFKALRDPDTPAQPRTSTGQFTRSEPEPVAHEEPVEIEAEAELAQADVEGEHETEVEAAEEAQPEPVDMPPSWGKEDAEHWNALPPETQAIIAQREGQRETAVNLKFQEAANVRKAAEAQYTEAQTSRAQYAEALEVLMQAVQPVKPDPRAFGYGTVQFDAAAYDMAKAEYDAQEGIFAQLSQQRDAQRAAAEEEETARFHAWKQEHEAQWGPKLMADVPELSDPVKAPTVLREIVNFALANGIPETAFADVNRVTSAELLLIHDAMQYRKQQEAKTRVAPKAKTAAPPVRPGVATPRATPQTVALQKDLKRLRDTGSIEAGAAVFRHFRQG